jgi:lipopolysaccharide export system protein LptA
MTPVAALRLLLTATTVAVVAAASAAGPASRVDITADELRLDAADRVATAAGRVRITDGVTTATAARATLFQREGRGVLTGDARVVAPEGTLTGQEITVMYTTAAITRVTAAGAASLRAEGTRIAASAITVAPSSDTLTASGRVGLTTPPGITAVGDRLTYRRVRGLLVMEGAVRMQNADGSVEGDRLEAFGRWDRAVVTGNVHGVFRDIEVRSRIAEVTSAEKKAVFIGDVRLTQPDRRMITERVTVWYAVGRVVAEGQTTIRLEPQP